MIKEKIKQINFAKKKVFIAVVVICVVSLIGGSFVLSESGWIKIIDGNKVIDIKKMEKEFNQQIKEENISTLKEIEQETPVIEFHECEETCGVPCNFNELLTKDRQEEVINILEKAVIQCPENRYYHKKLAYVLWDYYNDENKDLAILEQAIKEAEIALNMEIGFHIPNLLSKLLVESKDIKTLDRVFEKVLSTEDGRKLSYDDYIEALIKLDDPRTEEVLQKALDEKHVNDQVVLLYAEWLLDRERDNEVLLLPVVDHSYMYFYRGVALEKLGRLDEAKSEYAEYISRKMGSIPEMPKRFQIPGSELQKEMDIRFEDDEEYNSSTKIQTLTAISIGQAIRGLSYLIHGEAEGETLGGMRTVGWIVRNRVLRGSIGPSSCLLNVDNTGSTLAEKYRSVMCQSGQFDGMCEEWCEDPNTTECDDNSATYNSAYGVYYGYTPDPVSPHCPGGIVSWDGGYCADATYCYGYADTYRLAGPVLNYGTSGNCPSPHPGLGCGPDSIGKTCGNGGLDNCFYPYPTYCVGSGCVNYSGSISQPGQCVYSAYFYNSATGYHKGHLEGPESDYNDVDFDLYFWKWNGSSWQQVDSSIRYGSVEDINYYGTPGYYIWEVCAYTGSGNLMLYTSRPQ